MGNESLPLRELSISEIYMESKEPVTYMIPIYQRNYAWEEDQISALVKDVHDSFLKDKDKPYYIGTLVTYKCEDNVFEVIDGQQRLTTIYIILKALSVDNLRNKLRYSARKSSDYTIEKLGNDAKFTEEVDEGIKNGYKFADNAIKGTVSDEEIRLFTSYFLSQVKIIHYSVPKDVDLNHYFEVMNSRGEQLEMHEIVKSKLSQHLKGVGEMATFSKVWEACSEMNVYIQQALFKKENASIKKQYEEHPSIRTFGKDLSNFIINSFDEIPVTSPNEGKVSIWNIIDNPIGRVEQIQNTDQIDKFQPIIDFPNFLLIVLKLTRIQDEPDFVPCSFTLDDKELLNEFEKALDCRKGQESDFAKEFIFNLLKAKYFLDNYMIHHTQTNKEYVGDNPWKLQYLYKEGYKRYPRNVAGEDYAMQDEIVHLLSMFEVAFTPKQRKNYLLYCLLYLFKCEEFNPKAYLEFLQSLADKYFFGVYLDSHKLNERNLPKPNAFDETLLEKGKVNLWIKDFWEIDYRLKFDQIYKIGNPEISLFVFNYLDYKLWKKYAETLRGLNTVKGDSKRRTFFEELGCSDFDLKPFINFYFSRTRKSLEHYYPRANAIEGTDLCLENLNCLGNFAMIGAEANSSGNSWTPKTKLDHYTDRKSDPVSVASLKFKIMMQKCEDNYQSILEGKLSREKDKGLEWNFQDMTEHQEKMLNILFG